MNPKLKNSFNLTGGVKVWGRRDPAPSSLKTKPADCTSSSASVLAWPVPYMNLCNTHHFLTCALRTLPRFKLIGFSNSNKATRTSFSNFRTCFFFFIFFSFFSGLIFSKQYPSFPPRSPLPHTRTVCFSLNAYSSSSLGLIISDICHTIEEYFQRLNVSLHFCLYQ